MSHPLDACRAKVQRARFHVAELRQAILKDIESAPYRVVGHSNEATSEVIIVAEANPTFTGIPIHVPLIAGEAAHQLRSALDHLVWQLVAVNTGLPPSGNKSGFPIFRAEAGYVKRAAAMIAGVSDEAAHRIRSAQPFLAGANADRVLTWVLQELNNADKHRLIPVTIDHTSVVHVHLRKRDGTVIEVLAVQEELREPLSHGVEIVRLPVAAIEDGDSLDVPFAFDVAFERIGGVERHPATQLLDEIVNYVERLIESFEADFRQEHTAGHSAGPLPQPRTDVGR